MASKYTARIQAVVDTASIQQQLDKISQSVKPINISVNITGDGLEFINNFSRQLEKVTSKPITPTVDTSAIQGSFGEIDKIVTKNGEVISQTYRKMTDDAQVITQVTGKTVKQTENIGVVTRQNEKIQEQYKQALETTKTRVDNTVMSLKNQKEITQQIAAIENNPTMSNQEKIVALKQINTQLSAMGKNARGLGNDLATAYQKFAIWSVATVSWYGVVHAMQDMVKNVIELDTALTDLKKVTDISGAALDSFVDKAYDMATEVARTGKEVVEAVAVFARAGYSVSDSTTLAKDALLWTNVADGMVEVSDASDMIIANLKAFGKQGITSRHIIDSLNEVSNRFAVTSSDLSDSLENSASVLSNAGTSFEEFLGLVTAGTEVTRNANKVSNGLRTISLRLQGLTDEGEEDLELLPKLGKELGKIGVAVTDKDGELRSTFDILHDISVAYETLTNSEKTYYTELIAGKNRANIAAAVLENFGTAVNATATALDSSGSAMQENERYMESIQGHLNLLESEFQKLSQLTVESDFIKGFVDMGTGILKVVNSLGGLVPVLSIVLGLLIAIKAQKIATALSSVAGGLVKLLSNGGAVVSLFKEMATSGSLLSASLGTVLTGGIGIAIAAISLLVSAYNSWESAQKEAMRAAGDSAQATMDTVSSLEALKDEYNSILSSTEDDAQKQQDLTEFKKKLVEQYGFEKSAIDGVNDSRKEMLELIDQESTKNVEKWIAENAEEYKKAQAAIENGTGNSSATMMDSYSGGLMGFVSITDDAQAAVDRLNEAYKDYGITLNYTKEGQREYERYVLHASGSYEDMGDKVEKLNAIISVLEAKQQSSTGLTQEEISLLSILRNEYNSASEVLENYNDTYTLGNTIMAQYILLQNKAQKENVNSKESFEAYKEEMLAFAGDSKGLREAMEKLINEAFAELIASFEQGEEAAKSFAEQLSTLETLTKSLDELEKAYTSLSDVVAEYNENGSISAETLKNLLAMDSEYLDALEMVNGKLTINKEKLDEQAEALKNEALLANAAALGESIYAIMTKTASDESKNAKESIDDLGVGMENLKNSGITGLLGVSALAGGINELNKVARGEGLGELSDDMEVAVQAAIDNALKVQNAINSMTLTVGGSKGSGKKSSKKKDPLKEQSDIFKDQIKDLEHQLFLLEQIEGTEDARAALAKKIQDTLHEQAEWFRKQGLDDNSDYIQDLQKQWHKYPDYINDMYEGMLEDRMKLSEEYISEKNFYDNWGADSEIDSWKRVLAWLKTEYYDKGLISWETYAEKVKEVNKNLYSAIENMIDKVSEEQQAALEEQRKFLDKQQSDLETTFSYMTDQIQKEIDALNERKEAEEEYWDEKIKALREQNDEIDKQIELEKAQQALENARNQKNMRVYYQDRGKHLKALRLAIDGN